MDTYSITSTYISASASFIMTAPFPVQITLSNWHFPSLSTHSSSSLPSPIPSNFRFRGPKHSTDSCTSFGIGNWDLFFSRFRVTHLNKKWISLLDWDWPLVVWGGGVFNAHAFSPCKWLKQPFEIERDSFFNFKKRLGFFNYLTVLFF